MIINMKFSNNKSLEKTSPPYPNINSEVLFVAWLFSLSSSKATITILTG